MVFPYSGPNEVPKTPNPILSVQAAALEIGGLRTKRLIIPQSISKLLFEAFFEGTSSTLATGFKSSQTTTCKHLD